MRHVASITAIFIALIWAPLAIAQNQAYVPALGDIMSATQLRHIKLWFAGKLKNWDLASYELRQIRTSLEDAANLYHGIPVAYVGATLDPIRAIGAAIEAKDGARFAKGFNDLTAGCNSCHAGIGRGFIVIQVPTVSPFSDQSFVPHKP
jgi:hypothetical protein